jgi:trk system potassium uptake protein TrkH
MIIGALSFQIHYSFFIKRSFKRILKLTELKVFSAILIIVILVVIAVNFQEELVNNIFQASSALGTCGFNAVETPLMPVSALFLLNIAMILGGNSSSTTGGLKTRKIVWIFKGIFKSMRDLWRGGDNNQEKYVLFNEEDVPEKEAKEQILNSAFIFALWIISISAGTLFTLILEEDNYSLSQVLFDVSSALNNVGLSAGVTGHDMSIFSKWIFIVLMWIGRLEIYGCLVLLFIPVYFYRSKFYSQK